MRQNGGDLVLEDLIGVGELGGSLGGWRRWRWKGTWWPEVKMDVPSGQHLVEEGGDEDGGKKIEGEIVE